MKISIIEPLGSNGGIYHYNLGFCSSLKKITSRIEFYSSGDRLRSENLIFFNYFNLMQDKSAPKIFRFFGIFKGFLFSFCRILSFRPDLIIIHVFHFDFLDLLKIFIINLFRSKCLCIIHDWDDLNYVNNNRIKVLSGYFFTKTKFTVATHSDEVSELASKFFNLEVYLYPHYDFSNKTLIKSNLKYDFIFWGNVKKSKGVDLILNAAKLLSKTNNFKILIAGRFHENYFLEVSDFISNHNLNDFIEIINDFVPDDLLEPLISASHCVLLPYKQGYSSGVLLRAIDYEKDIISSDLRCFTKYITDGINGLLFKTNDSVDLADKMHKYLISNYSFNINILKSEIIHNNDLNLYPRLVNKLTT